MIFGQDNRVAYSANTITKAPFVRILAFYANGSSAQGSGVMVGANAVLTAAHMIYDSTAGWATQVLVLPDQTSATLPFGASYASQLFTPVAWQTQQDFSQDYGIITTSNSIGYATGWLNIADPNTSSPSVGDMLTSIGYPGDLAVQEYKTSGTVDSIQTSYLLFNDDMDAMPGQSGSPVLNSSNQIVGIISHQSVSPNTNAATYINSSTYSQLEAHISSSNLSASAAPMSSSYQYDDFAGLYRLYQGIFMRDPDTAGVNWWLNQTTQGKTLVDVAQAFLSTLGESNRFATSTDNSQFVDTLYQQLFNRTADSGGKAYWVNALNHGMSEAAVIVNFTQSTEYQLNQSIAAYQYWHQNLNSFALNSLGTNYSETLTGTTGDDVIFGYDGNDTLIGYDGNDYLYGGAGNDVLTGGAGKDYFAYDNNNFGNDIITDFSLKDDMIRLRDTALHFSASSDSNGNLVLSNGYGGTITLQGITINQASQIMFV